MNTDGIPKMTNDCKELFSIFMKIGGSFISDFENNEGELFPQKIICKNLHEIHKNLREFQHAHIFYPIDEVVRVNFMRRSEIKPPKIQYDSVNDVRNMRFSIKFDKDGRY